jgi:PIN domain nuclease of toxin-antitoxin system
MLLLDTHVFLWWLAADRRLSRRLRARIASPATEVLVSAASIWEMAIKIAIGKLDMPGTDPARLDALVTACGFRELAITAAHATAVATLPRLHGDPFDRLLVAQARAEGATLVSTDPALRPYGVPILAR